jgi:outer membrane protein OmpA-like peptidoglycan-associated protein
MRRLVGVSALGLALALAPAATFAQQSQASSPAPVDVSEYETRPATTSASGTTGLWFVPTGSVLQHRTWSLSLYRTNIDDGQGFADVSRFPITFAYGIGGRTELFGNIRVVNRIDRDTRPLFFNASVDGTGGGIILEAPRARREWSGNKFGDMVFGGKVNLLPDAPAAVALRGMVTLPTGDDEVSVAGPQFQVDAIVSHFNPAVEVAGFGGLIVRGNPSGYELTNGLRWGIGAAFPQRYSGGFRITTELFSEIYFDKTVTAPAGEFGSDGSPVPTTTELRSPIVAALGLTWQAPNGFFVGGGASWNLSQKGRETANIGFENTFRDSKGLQVRIGWHPGARHQNAAARVPPPPPAPPAPVAPPTPQAPANRPPTVDATCDPCEVEVGRTSTVTADGQDPDGDPLTYQWKTAAGTVANPTVRQSPWTAPMQPGPVPVTVTVNDGRGGTASDSVTINVIRPREFVFEDVHFEFDRFNIRPDALRVLDEAVTAMQANTALRLTIEGHTCNIGTAEYNLALGERRASAVRDYLASRGIGADRLQTVSFGEERPKHDNGREETRRLNRRAALTVRLQ